MQVGHKNENDLYGVNLKVTVSLWRMAVGLLGTTPQLTTIPEGGLDRSLEVGVFCFSAPLPSA